MLRTLLTRLFLFILFVCLSSLAIRLTENTHYDASPTKDFLVHFAAVLLAAAVTAGIFQIFHLARIKMRK